MTPSPFFTVSLVLETLGLFLWFWGSWPLLETQPLLVRLHKLTVADALGSLLMLMGLMVQTMDRQAALIGFSESPENVTLVGSQIENGIWLPDV